MWKEKRCVYLIKLISNKKELDEYIPANTSIIVRYLNSDSEGILFVSKGAIIIIKEEINE